MQELVNISKTGKMKNCCEHCGGIDTLWPIFRARGRYYSCDSCGKLAKGIAPEDYKKGAK
jgi:hypothetical protein